VAHLAFEMLFGETTREDIRANVIVHAGRPASAIRPTAVRKSAPAPVVPPAFEPGWGGIRFLRLST
jgi:hypothetical protein